MYNELISLYLLIFIYFTFLKNKCMNKYFIIEYHCCHSQNTSLEVLGSYILIYYTPFYSPSFASIKTLFF